VLDEEIANLKREHGYIRCYAGMASGVDCWFCHSCLGQEVPYVACIPFEEQAETMTKEEADYRQYMIDNAIEKRMVKNSWMVEECDMAVVVWDGNKGGTHNVVQQLVEKKKPFVWVNPVAQVVWRCLLS
jgi:uncharacterized phage-like protein YoqJ